MTEGQKKSKHRQRTKFYQRPEGLQKIKDPTKDPSKGAPKELRSIKKLGSSLKKRESSHIYSQRVLPKTNLKQNWFLALQVQKPITKHPKQIFRKSKTRLNYNLLLNKSHTNVETPKMSPKGQKSVKNKSNQVSSIARSAA